MYIIDTFFCKMKSTLLMYIFLTTLLTFTYYLVIYKTSFAFVFYWNLNTLLTIKLTAKFQDIGCFLEAL